MFSGQTILQIAHKHLNEKYVLGAVAPLANPSWTGPWDCAEFASWCTYQAYRIIYAVRPADPVRGESFSGWWYEDAKAGDDDVSVDTALATPGAILVRRPTVVNGKRRIGHVAISMGDGITIEAKDRATGVAIVPGAKDRLWHTGVFIPGVHYQTKAASPYAEPSGLLQLTKPYLHSPQVLALQKALLAAGISPGGRDGYFGPMTEAAVVSFQVREGLVPDGVVGPQTAVALGLGWPLTATAGDEADFAAVN